MVRPPDLGLDPGEGEAALIEGDLILMICLDEHGIDQDKLGALREVDQDEPEALAELGSSEPQAPSISERLDQFLAQPLDPAIDLLDRLRGEAEPLIWIL
jgi:hypothetical protein